MAARFESQAAHFLCRKDREPFFFADIWTERAGGKPIVVIAIDERRHVDKSKVRFPPIRRVWSSDLLYILNLLPHLFDQYLEFHGAAGGIGDDRF